jgi:release factor glutamine methyltransferase
MPTIKSALQSAHKQFDAAGIDSPASTARRLLAHTLGRTREWLIAHDDMAIQPEQLHQFNGLVARVLKHEPLAYILGSREFFDLNLFVDARVLVPRPETEMLVELALKQLQTPCLKPPVVVEIGTGSGAAAIAIAKHAPYAQVIATDISTDALDVAKLNAQQCNVYDRIEFYCGDLLWAVPPDHYANVCVIVANLPYVTREEIEILPPEIQAHEPRVALDGGKDGLDLVRALLCQIRDEILPHPNCLQAIFLEIGASQGKAALNAAQNIFATKGSNAQCKILKDLARLDRVLAVDFAKKQTR